MSIRYDFRTTGMFPTITCEVCGKTIHSSSKEPGIVAWTEDGKIGYAHTGECGHRLHRVPFYFWEELPIFLFSLAHNTGCTLKELKAAKKRHDFLLSIGLAAGDQ
jgi:hypothetical protein